MKLLHLNIWEGKLLKEVLAFVDKEQPDILCLQEVFSCAGDIILPDVMFNSLELIKAQTGFPYCFFSPLLTSVYAGVPAQFGLAIISRFPLTDQQTVFTHGSYTPNLTANSHISNTRLLQICKVQLADTSLSLANHHAHMVVDPLGNETSVAKMQFVKSQLEQLPRPLVFSGDLNVKSESPAMRVFDGFLKDLTAEYEVATTLSQLGKVTNVACDHVLVSDDVRVTNFRVADDLVSDHKGLLMEFEV